MKFKKKNFTKILENSHEFSNNFKLNKITARKAEKRDVEIVKEIFFQAKN